MNEEMLKAYLDDKGLLVHGYITEAMTAGDMVMFADKSKDGIYAEQHMIPLLDIVVWMWEKNNEQKDQL